MTEREEGLITVEPAELLPWSALEAVLASTGESRRCWCRWWLTTNAEYAAATDDDRRAAARADHADGHPRGLLARRAGEAVGWVSVAPRADYVRLPRTRLIADGTPDPDLGDPAIWAIVCFAVAPAHRRTGVARALLDAAIAHAAAHGAARIEAYPVDTDPAHGRAPSPGDLNTGTLALFATAGFTEVARPKPHRPIVQRRLRLPTDDQRAV
ncbi:GNAT family N-acetyltransferase [Microcella frigidaquae]|uniref:Ribosomal protein S18 acetylase RimI-like enzyme n=1 Tax=Microcella frigidaquae TaxID=424758 RepID=A0A840XJA1_9MICO|nr:ribosomal protein S18 acetylase RimI-like enzyme [Microcella frigidaquae]NHN43629.1 GNAT family N-acetyltransferase [Microcella frigidaquae]